jgi:hypothetical protein
MPACAREQDGRQLVSANRSPALRVLHHRMAMKVPVPMAMPTSAARAGASSTIAAAVACAAR